jgi:hypothetical protein
MAGPDDDDPVDERSMFMDVLRIDPGADLVHLSLMDTAADGSRPQVDGDSIDVTVPLSQFEPLMDDFAKAFQSQDYLDRATRAIAPTS